MSKEEFIEKAESLHYSKKDIDELIEIAEKYNADYGVFPLVDQSDGI